MQRRSLLIGAGAAAAALLSAPGARALGADAAVLLVPGARPLMLRRFAPAEGPLARHAARPGAWYALLYLPLTAGWPMQLQLWPVEAGRELALIALDAAPDEAPGVAHRLPIEPAIDPRDVSGRLSRFMLPAKSRAPGLFVLIELWRLDGERPMPLWAQWHRQTGPRQDRVPWWASRDAGADPAQAPASPLARQAQVPRDARAHEVPILALQPSLDAGVWR